MSAIPHGIGAVSPKPQSCSQASSHCQQESLPWSQESILGTESAGIFLGM